MSVGHLDLKDFFICTDIPVDGSVQGDALNLASLPALKQEINF